MEERRPKKLLNQFRTVLPDSLIPFLQEHLQRVKALHEQHLSQRLLS
jgi:hypothetical protein